MKVIFIIGDSAVGKMTVGQYLSEDTGYLLFYNHLVIEPVLELYGYYKKELVANIRKVYLKDIALSGENGVIITLQVNFDNKEDIEYIRGIKNIFNIYCMGTEFYYVELDCSVDERLRRNKTENRLEYKRSKRDIFRSEELLMQDMETKRCVSNDEDIAKLEWVNFIRIDNTEKSAQSVAQEIEERFGL